MKKSILSNLFILIMIFACNQKSNITSQEEEIEIYNDYSPIGTLYSQIEIDHYPSLGDTVTLTTKSWLPSVYHDHIYEYWPVSNTIIEFDREEIGNDGFSISHMLYAEPDYVFGTPYNPNPNILTPISNTHKVDSTFWLGDTFSHSLDYVVTDTGYVHIGSLTWLTLDTSTYTGIEPLDDLNNFSETHGYTALTLIIRENYGELWESYLCGGQPCDGSPIYDVMDTLNYWDFPVEVEFDLISIPSSSLAGNMDWSINALNITGYATVSVSVSNLDGSSTNSTEIWNGYIEDNSNITGNFNFTQIDTGYNAIELLCEFKYNEKTAHLSKRKYFMINSNGSINSEIFIDDIMNDESLKRTKTSNYITFNEPEITINASPINPIDLGDGDTEGTRDCDGYIDLFGQITYTDRNGITQPLHNATIYAYDDDIFIDDFINSGITNWNGEFEINNIENCDGWGTIDLFIVVNLGNTEIKVINNNGNTYQFISNTYDDLAAGSFEINQSTPDGIPYNEATWLFSYLNEGWLYLTSTGQWPGEVILSYSADYGPAFLPSIQQIHIPSNENNWAHYPHVIIHEYGHAIQYNAYNGEGIVGAGGVHDPELCENQGLAWSEGWGNFLPCAVYDVGVLDDPYGGRQVENTPPNCCEGDSNELRVAGALLDLLDIHNDGLDINNDCTVSFSEIWSETMWNSHHNSLEEFWEELSLNLNDCQYPSGLLSIQNNTIDYDYLNILQLGNISFENDIDIIDLTLLVDFILGNLNLTNTEQYIADLNQDGIINIIDVLALINIILGNDSIVNNATTTYISGIIEAIEDGQRYKYNIDMLNEQDVYILHFELQFDNKIPLYVIKGTRSNDMTLTHVYKEENNTLNIMVYSPEGRKITPGFGTILEIELETTGLGREGELTNGSEFIITNLANNPETLIPVEIVSADELSRLAEIQPSSLPTEYNLYSVYPNPFNPTTNITYELPEDSFITIAVYNLAGRKVDELVSGLVQSGRYNITWNADQFSSGVYFVTMTAPNFTTSQKVVLFK
ncbi:MAG: T9SS type A sorting domain-containing protein [Candidatus Pelagibacter sp.]|nr:T9SS type A sorting domain-containing protein [Candidatus Pelagibacter sp.]